MKVLVPLATALAAVLTFSQAEEATVAEPVALVEQEATAEKVKPDGFLAVTTEDSDGSPRQYFPAPFPPQYPAPLPFPQYPAPLPLPQYPAPLPRPLPVYPAPLPRPLPPQYLRPLPRPHQHLHSHHHHHHLQTTTTTCFPPTTLCTTPCPPANPVYPQFPYFPFFPFYPFAW